MMEGRRYSEGLHQALEAKEGVTIQNENQTLASITFQNYFRLYPKLAGMTGTAMTEAAEFGDIYRLDVIEIPTNRADASARTIDDEVYRTAREKIRRDRRGRSRSARERQQPVLVGTVSIEKSEASVRRCSRSTRSPHQVLNARYHEQEALHHRAGRPARRRDHRHQHGRPRHRHPARRQRSTCAIAPSGSCRGPDGARAARAAAIRAEIEAAREQVRGAGGLFVIGTERHESRRIDNQLRGRSGRQGDPGALEILRLARRRSDARSSAPSGWTRCCSASASRKARRSSTPGSTRRSRRRSRRSRRATSRSASSC